MSSGPPHSTYPSLRQLAEQFAQSPEYGPLRTYIRGTISMALGEGKRDNGRRELTDRECVTHSLICSWLDQNGYHIASQMMKTQMAANYVETPEKHLQKPSENIDFLLKNILKINIPKLDRTRKIDQNSPAFPKVDKIEMRRQPIKITPLSDEEFKKTMRKRLELERARLSRGSIKIAQGMNLADEDDDSDSSSSEESTSSSSSECSENSPKQPENEEEKEEEKPEKISFADIMKSQKSLEEEEENLEKSSGILGGLSFLGNPTPKAWGPSKSGLVTDDVPHDSLPSIGHLPPLSMNRPTLKTAKSVEIDALFGGDDDNYDLDDFEEDEVTPRKENPKPVNVVSPVVKKDEQPKMAPQQAEPVVLSEDESIDELEDFDADLLSSGGSDYSF